MDSGAGNDEPATTSSFVEQAPANLLLLGPAVENEGNAVSRLLETTSGTPALLAVSLLRPPAEVLSAWETAWLTPPSEIAAVGCKNTAGSHVDKTPETNFRSTSVADPGDLTGLGIRVSECLKAWEHRPTVVTFDSVTTMLQYADTRRVFQFLHVLTRQLDSAGAMSVFHMDPEAHDGQTVSTIRSLFQGVYERSEDGWERA
ncbi:hypothetical protein DP107_14610 [Haloglomus irregulare]|jgi:hypothetical protein|uniref:KaiC-like domain-containing protein n=1 Tax=Haloglomus irregulare TaxID=2234134 RepID=A0A554MWV3_9EURY|nr:hypothetical protein [Haloglomus irregulare]TSD09606.1 hypothetical protein DP107_14610 [Haloglomus irregulare]